LIYSPFYERSILTDPEQDHHPVHLRYHHYQRYAVPACRFIPVLVGMDLPCCHFCAAVFAVSYFLKNDPGLLERRMKMREKTGKQKRIVLLSAVIFFLAF
jgi:hypothetical protein